MISTDIDLAVARLRAGGLVAIPTETVYGLAADASNPDAVARIFAVKGRPVDHPLIVHLGSADDLDDWAVDIPDSAVKLAAACWPGPLTLLLPRGPRAIDAVTGGRSTIGVRVPSHPVLQAMLRRFGGGIAAPSANRFGKVSPTTAQHVLDDLGHVLDPERDLVLDGGPCEVGVESTIVDLTVSPHQILRAGAITDDQIVRLLGGEIAAPSGASRASGMLASHYSPDCTVIPARSSTAAETIAAEWRDRGRRVGVLDRTDDLVVAAQRLYADFRAADEAGLDALVVVLPAPQGLGHAIRDRIMKAAADPAGPSRAD
jgi:L-threonylcarbamoyladenylate synthase